MRAAFVVLVAAVAILISGCSGGSGKSHSGRGAYFDAIESMSYPCSSPTSESTPNFATSISQSETKISAFATLVAPTELAVPHRDFVRAEEDLVNSVRGLSDLTAVAENAGAIDAARAYATAETAWDDAFAAHYGARLFRMEGASMEPAFHNGDLLAFSPYNGEKLSRWQIIVFKFPLDETRWFAKRVVGLPGETVEIRDGVIKINGTPVAGDTFALASANYSWGPRPVPSDSYFVLGDNRRNSYDSHAWGMGCPSSQRCDFVPRDLILGVLPPTGTKPLSQWWCPLPEARTPTP